MTVLVVWHTTNKLIAEGKENMLAEDLKLKLLGV